MTTEKIFENEKNDLCCFKELSKGDIFKVREGNYYYMRLNDDTEF